jgi:hypothetical protein
MNRRHYPIRILLITLAIAALPAAAAPGEKSPEPKELLAEAVTSAGAIADRDEKDDALMRVIHAQSTIGDAAGAQQTAKLVRNPQKQGFASRAIAAGYARGGDVKTATAMADAATNAGAKSGILEEIVAAQIEQGDLAAARATRASIAERFYAAHADRRIAVAQAASGDVATAKQTLAGIQGAPDVKVQGYLDIAGELLKAKNVAAAKEMIQLAVTAAREVPDYLRPMSVAAICGTLVKAGAADPAMGIANRIAEPRDKALALSHIAEAQAEIGDVAGSRATAKLLPADDQVRPQVLFARAQMKSGDAAAARQSLADARALADKIEIPTLRAFAYETVLAAQVELGDAGPAAEQAKGQKDPIVRTYSLVAVARALAKK